MFVAKAIFDMTIYISLMNQTIITKYRQKKKTQKNSIFEKTLKLDKKSWK